jgi:hypothetical protein
MSSRPPPSSRIVVALDPSGPSEVTLEIARHIPSGLATELLGLFVEDIRLFEHARSRLAREVVLSGRARPLDVATLERQIRAQAAKVRARFEAAAAKLGLPHAFQITRGEVIAELLREAAQADALVVSLAAGATRQQAWWSAALRELAEAPLKAVLFARDGGSTGSGIVTVTARAEGLTTTLETAARLAKHGRAPLTILVTGSALEHWESVSTDLPLALRALGVELQALSRVTTPTAEAIADVARRLSARLVVLPAREAGADVDLIGELLRRLRSSLLLVGGP